jgi:gluconolactonase
MASIQVTFHKHQPSNFVKILGANPQVSVLADGGDLPLYHEACIYHAPSCSVFVTSNQLATSSDQATPESAKKIVKLTRVYDSEPNLATGPHMTKVEDITFPTITGAMLNGGVNFDSENILLCAQGSRDLKDPSGIIKVTIASGARSDTVSETVIGSFHGIPFNSVNDVIVHPHDLSIWFTDPPYGFHQGIRPPPQLPNHVYRYDPKNGSIRVVADGFTRPNGLCFSPELDTLYVTDTGAVHGSSSVPLCQTGPSHIYAFDVVFKKGWSEPFLANRRVFAYAPGKVPDGIKCDTRGNVYAGCTDGIEVWDPSGVLIGTIDIPGGVSNFCFGEKGTVYACNETKLLKIHLDGEGVKGALLGI